MNLFRKLSPEEEKEFRQWAKDNYIPFTEILSIWHPIVQQECGNINVRTHREELEKEEMEDNYVKK